MLTQIFGMNEALGLERNDKGIEMCEMSKVKKVIERRKYKAIKRGGFYPKYKLNNK